MIPRLNKLDGIQELKTTPDGALEFQFAPGEDLRPKVARYVIEAGYDLLELRVAGLSLEEIFLELTKDNVKS